MGVLSTAADRQNELLRVLEREFGPIHTESPHIEFSFTDYYDNEMGGRPDRFFLLFENPVDPALLADIKTRTNEIEMLFADAEGKRRINLDPGILSLSSFILATCKDRSHRIPLKSGIYAETTLIYQNRDFQRLPWTYADYSSDGVRAILRDFRTEYRKTLVKEIS